jgi:hypothetical protein
MKECVLNMICKAIIIAIPTYQLSFSTSHFSACCARCDAFASELKKDLPNVRLCRKALDISTRAKYLDLDGISIVRGNLLVPRSLSIQNVPS